MLNKVFRFSPILLLFLFSRRIYPAGDFLSIVTAEVNYKWYSPQRFFLFRQDELDGVYCLDLKRSHPALRFPAKN